MPKPLIVVTTDFSADSYECFASAGELARKLGARISLVHAAPANLPATYDLPLGLPEPDPGLDQVIERARDDLEKLRDRFPDGVELDVAVASGTSVDQAILDFASEHGATMIAMASHGRSGLRRLILGSVAESVLRHAKIPVMIFPKPTSHSGRSE